jgi:hypothetical protein
MTDPTPAADEQPATRPARRGVAIAVSVEVFEADDERGNAVDELDRIVVLSRIRPIIEHLAREARSDVVPVATLAEDVTEQMYGLIDHIRAQLATRYPTPGGSA